jgi:hypothetical protein
MRQAFVLICFWMFLAGIANGLEHPSISKLENAITTQQV